MKRVFALLITLLLALGLCVPALAAQEGGYVIANPYKDVVWDGENAWGAYTSNLHGHTTFSDGTDDMQSMVEAYYAHGYDVIANTDHGVTSVPWDERPKILPLLHLPNINRTHALLTAERAKEINDGAGRGGRGMLQVPMGNELQAATPYKSHVVGLYTDWGQGWLGFSFDYRIPIAGVHKNGGITFIAHPGDWLGSKDDPAIAREPGNVNFFADILRDYDSCLGIEIYNGSDNETRHDRIFWDELLMRLMPEGRPVWGFAVDDSHNVGDVNRQASVLLMPANTTDNVRACLESGAFLACSRRDRVLDIDVSDKSIPFPGVTNITVEGNTITLEANNYTKIEWIADGEVVGTGLSVDVSDGKIASYVRAQLIGSGGITATQPFRVNKIERHPGDALQGWEKFAWTAKMVLTKNVAGFLVEFILKQFA